jgi:acyl transferase domain-containing protein/acyl carrier protein/SAM-dependent methyltransferase
MLSVINRYSHGFVAVPIILACKSLKLFGCIGERKLNLAEITSELKANSGFLLVSLRLLESMQWLSQDAHGRYSVTPLGRHEHENVPEHITSLFDFPIDNYLGNQNSDLTLREWIDCSIRGWDTDDILLPYLLDGMLMVPLLLGLQRSPFYDSDVRSIKFENLASTAREEILRLFRHKGWCDDNADSPELTDIGKFMMERIMNTGTVASYTPMLKRIGTLIAGDPATLFVTDQDGHEIHVERTLNVVSSGFQHDRYFRAMEDIFASIFNELPIENQPRYIADVGCGDGTLLRRVYNMILKTERGKVLDQHPVTLIGVDFNHKALEATHSTLHDINHMVLHGDIGNPKQIEIDLEQHIKDVEKVLYIRSFLDHDRPFIEPTDYDQIQQRSNIKYECISVDKTGALIPPAVAVQSLAEHLVRWSGIRSKYGIVILEVHCLPAGTTAKYVNESENLHFDAYHAFSKQHLVEAHTFLASAAEAGLIFNEQSSKRYPTVFPYTRITLNHFRPKGYRIRMANRRDIDLLAAMEQNLPVQLRSSPSDIEERIRVYPEGQMVAEIEGKLAGVIYSRRTSEGQVGVFLQSRKWEHDANGNIVELLYAIVPDAQLRGELIAFMKGYSRVMNGVDQVVGGSDCMQSGAREYVPGSLAACLITSVGRFVDCYDIKPEQDTLVPETILEDFGAKWLLSIFQSMGVLRQCGEWYPSADSIGERLGVLPKYKSLFASLIGIFERKGLIKRMPDGLETTEKIEGFALTDIQREYDEFERAFRKEHPESVPFMTLMATCLSSYGEVLTGAKEATDVVFPQGSMELFAGIFKDSSVADYFNRLIAEIVHECLMLNKRNGASGKLRVLEIGAGTGGVTRFVLDRLGDLTDSITFYYTDISSTFVRHGQRTFGTKHSCMEFERLNIEYDPVEQGFNEADFDLVYASNVLHDTKFLMNTLAQVNKLLRPEGLLVLNEFTVMKDLLLYTGGLLHGWWLFQDPENRLPNSCLLSVPYWKQILEKSGFVNFAAYGLPFDETLDHCRQSVMFCTKTGNAGSVARIVSADCELQQEIKACVPAEDCVSPGSQLTDRGEAEKILPMVAQTIKEIIGAKRFAQFDPAMPLMEQGVDSLELVELNALLSKKTGLRLETTFLFQFNTAEKLSGYFRQKLEAPQENHASTQINTETEGGKEAAHEAPAKCDEAATRDIATEIEQIIQGLIGAKRMTLFTRKLPLMELGIDSLELLELRTLIGKKFGVELNASFLFQYNTCAKIAAYLEKHGASWGDGAGNAGKATGRTVNVAVSDTVQSGCDAPDVLAEIGPGDVAIVGMALRFPGNVTGPDEFWDLLKTGTSAIRKMPPNRLRWPADVDVAGEKSYLTKGGFLDRVDEFDAEFFRISPMEAELMDPQQRMLLELVWGALEDAGYKPSGLSGSETGVYVGACHFEYRSLLEQSGTSQGAFVATGSSGSILANRISYFYNFQGPSLLVDTACSSSLVAVHKAVRDLREGACRQALVGGVNLICNTVNVLAYDHAGMLSKDSKCSTFDETANGYVRGEGGAVILLKRLRDAVDDQDQIYAVIKGSAVNHGGQSSSLTAPNPEAQGKLIVRAAEDSQLDGATISYIEAHGTGTRLGDPIEVDGLNQAFCHFADTTATPLPQRVCGIGSVKSNIGHLEGASGIAGLIKATLSLKHRMIPPTLNFKRLNAEINLGQSFHIAAALKEWEVRLDAEGRAIPRRAGVSAFGFGGAKAHVILQEYPQTGKCVGGNAPYLFVLSARNDDRLIAMAKRYVAFLGGRSDNQDFSLLNLSYTLQIAREEMDERLAIVFDSKEELISMLTSVVEGRRAAQAIYRGNRKMAATAPLQADGKRRDAESALQRADMHKLAALWTEGYRVKWEALYEGKPVRRISLPGYAFAKNRYWISDDNPDDNRSTDRHGAVHPNGVPVLLPVGMTSSRSRFMSIFSGNEPFLIDHVVNGRKVLPGVMYLEIARAAAGAVSTVDHTGTYLRLRNVVWASPVFVDDFAVTLYTTVNDEGEGKLSFEMGTRPEEGDGQPQLHGEGEIEFFQVPAVPAIDLNSKLRACTESFMDAEEFYEAFHSIGIDYGSSHKGISEIHLGHGEVLAKLSIPPQAARESAALFMHPGILDSALQASFAFGIKEKNHRLMLPFVLDEVEIFAPCSGDMWTWIRCGEKSKSGEHYESFDIDVCDHRGVVCVRMKGYRPKMPGMAFGTKTSRSESLMLAPAWEQVSDIHGQILPPASERVIIIGGQAGEKRILIERFRNARELHIEPGESIELITEKLRRAGPIDHIVWGTSAGSYISMTDEALIAGQEKGAIFGLRLIKALLQLEYGARELKWTVVTTQACAIRKNEHVSPAQASIHGLIGAMAKEFVDWKVRLVDIEAGKDWPLDALLALPPDVEGNPWAFRRGRWYRQQLIPTQASDAGIEQYRHGGVYVVIGGAGGIGHAWSEFVAERYQARIVWIGRKPADESIEKKLDAVARRGPRPLYIAADARDRGELQRAYDEIKRHYSSINGVVHSAIVLLDQSLSNMSEDRFRAALSSKVDVCVRMAQVFRHERLDFAMFFSSITAFTKVAGQGNYAAGCVFKDAFAHQLRHEWNCDVKVMNWGYWGTVGIVATKERQEKMARDGIGSIEPAEAMNALEILLSSSVDQMAFLKLSDAAAS